MSKPWEERWDAQHGTVAAMIDATETAERRLGLATDEVATFAAQAPAMARLLDEWLREGDMDPDAVRRVLLAAGMPS